MKRYEIRRTHGCLSFQVQVARRYEGGVYGPMDIVASGLGLAEATFLAAACNRRAAEGWTHQQVLETVEVAGDTFVPDLRLAASDMVRFAQMTYGGVA